MPAMPTPQAETTPVPEAIDKEAVARRLKISERTANSLAEKGIIEARKVRSANNQLVWMFHSGDVERYAFERDNGETAIFEKVPQASQLALPAPEKKPALKWTDIMWPWLTLDEAVLSGLARTWLLEQCRIWETEIAAGEESTSNEVAVRDMGRLTINGGIWCPPGGRWRFHRESLDKA